MVTIDKAGAFLFSRDMGAAIRFFIAFPNIWLFLKLCLQNNILYWCVKRCRNSLKDQNEIPLKEIVMIL